MRSISREVARRFAIRERDLAASASTAAAAAARIRARNVLPQRCVKIPREISAPGGGGRGVEAPGRFQTDQASFASANTAVMCIYMQISAYLTGASANRKSLNARRMHRHEYTPPHSPVARKISSVARWGWPSNHPPASPRKRRILVRTALGQPEDANFT